jgi:hypothetical protein
LIPELFIGVGNTTATNKAEATRELKSDYVLSGSELDNTNTMVANSVSVSVSMVYLADSLLVNALQVRKIH